jgi:hypothetical protein
MTDPETPSIDAIRSNVNAATEAIKVTRDSERQRVGAVRYWTSVTLLGLTQWVLASVSSGAAAEQAKDADEASSKDKAVAAEDSVAKKAGGSDASSGGGGKVAPPKQLEGLSSRNHDALERNAGWLTLVTGILLVVALIYWDGDSEKVFWYCAIALCGFLLSGIVLFTRSLSTEADLNALFRFSWSFVAVVAVFGVLFLSLGFADRPGFSVPGRSAGEPVASQTAPSEPRQVRKPYMLAIVPGCDYDSIPSRNGQSKSGDTATDRELHTGMPEKIFCGDLPPQWVLVIGGSIVDCHFDGSCPRAPKLPNFGEAKRKHQLEASRLADAKQRLTEATLKVDGVRSLQALGFREAVSEDDRQALDTAKVDVIRLSPEVDQLKADLDIAAASKDFLHYIEGNPIVGGVVVPVFFIAIAMVGALINMGRKLTEFQERATDNYRRNYDTSAAGRDGTNPPLSREAARDMLVFQNIQVLTAPGIAVLAYAWVRPEQQAVTVILAFAAGFSSEVFLMAVRGIVDQVIGLGPRPSRVRMLTAADSVATGSKDAALPRGENQAKTSSGGFKVGDIVRLEQPVGPCLPGAEGVVQSIEPDGELIVRTTRDHTGAALSYRLQSQPPESFAHIGAAPKTDSGPAG